MVLKKEHFIAKEINWNDKANNILKISKELNIGLDSIVFIDDNPVEREQVKILLPEVYVPNWSMDPSLYSITLDRMRIFDQISYTKDDINRNKTYLENKKRKKYRDKHLNREDWLKNLDTLIEINKLNEENYKRVLQLFNKTNQFNLSTRRLTEKELKFFYLEEKNTLFTINVFDKFGL